MQNRTDFLTGQPDHGGAAEQIRPAVVEKQGAGGVPARLVPFVQQIEGEEIEMGGPLQLGGGEPFIFQKILPPEGRVGKEGAARLLQGGGIEDRQPVGEPAAFFMGIEVKPHPPAERFRAAAGEAQAVFPEVLVLVEQGVRGPCEPFFPPPAGKSLEKGEGPTRERHQIAQACGKPSGIAVKVQKLLDLLEPQQVPEGEGSGLEDLIGRLIPPDDAVFRRVPAEAGAFEQL